MTAFSIRLACFSAPVFGPSQAPGWSWLPSSLFSVSGCKYRNFRFADDEHNGCVRTAIVVMMVAGQEGARSRRYAGYRHSAFTLLLVQLNTMPSRLRVRKLHSFVIWF